MNKKFFFLLLVILLCLFVSCKTNTGYVEPVVEIEEEEEPEIEIGPIFIPRKAEIVLEGNATTGYEWTVIPDNSGVYEVVSEDYVPIAVPAGLVGVGGNYIAELKSVKEGEGTIVLEYARGWENAPIKRFEFKIMVDATGRFTVAEKR